MRDRLAAAALAALGDPDSWTLALGGFLVRGGVVFALAPIVVLPSVAGLANAFGPALIGFVFGGPSPAFIQLVALASAVAAASLVVSVTAGAALDLALVSRVSDGSLGRPAPRALLVAIVARLLAHLPTAAVLAWAAVRIVSATYEELIAPGAPTIPIPVRVALRVPDAVGLLVLAWVAGEAVGGIALRRAWRGASLVPSLASAVRALLRPSGLATLIATNVVVWLALVPLLVVPAPAFDRVRALLADGVRGVELAAALALLVATWLGCMLVASVGLAFRQLAWTLQVIGEPGPDHGTIGPAGG